ncbi:MAG: MoxR family ATPase [Proteobacteria bacterium]|nr:MoxR family ATPase [Pseudomonadota bacterium]
MQSLIQASLSELNRLILGKETALGLALSCLFADGHLLVEDLPGMGKTTLAQGLAKVLGLKYTRVQFTSDLLPADLIGASIFEPNTGQFRFHPGPVFSQLLMADELNRATPKAQSALLEAMEERQVSTDGQTHVLPAPFFVIATQNPQSQAGTFPLPESQLDRFLMRIRLGYPDPRSERSLLKGEHGRMVLDSVRQVISADALIKLQKQVSQVRVSDSLLDYVQRLVAQTRHTDVCQLGLSPRGALALVKCAQSRAMIEGRDYVLPEDVQQVFVAVAGHRIIGRTESHGDQLAGHILSNIDVVA